MRWGLLLGLLLLALGSIFYDALTTGAGLAYLLQRGQTFVTIFLGIFIEAVPFLLAGSIVSGLIAVFVDQAWIDRYMPRRALVGSLAGGLMGIVFPVCECGVVPVVRRLFGKGLPISTGIAFLLAAPAINPVAIFSTYMAFGFGPILWGRILFSYVIAVTVGYLFSRAEPAEVLLPEVSQSYCDACCAVHASGHGPQEDVPKPRLDARMNQAMRLAGDDFFDMARYLVVGSMLAAVTQTLIPQTLLLNVGQGPLISVLVMVALAFVLSICSTVDAFLARAFATTFTTGSVVSFLVFGPMVDIKSTIMFLGVFRRRTVGYLVLLPLVLSILAGVWWNMNVGF
ncbi:MAG: permease [Caldilineaceae bacterium]